MNKGQIQVIHVAKKQVGMTEDEYRDLLESVGVETCKDLTNKGFSIVMNHFEQLGFKSKSKFCPGHPDESLPEGKRGYLKKIDAILQDIGEDRAYADGLAKKRFKVEKVHWLKPENIRKVMQMLIYHQERVHERRSAQAAGE